MKLPHVLRVGAAILIFASAATPSFAATISGISVNNTSAANGISPTGTDNYGEFGTLSTLGAVAIAGDTASFQHRIQFYNGYYVGPSGPNFALTHQRNVSFDLFFTIEDPTNIGYALTVDSLLRGYSTALWTGGPGVSSAVVAKGTTFSGRIDTDTTDASDTLGTQLNGLTLGVGGATANDTNTSVNNSGTNTDLYNAGAFSGTRSFGLRFTTFGSGNTNVFLQNHERGQGSVRFGLQNADARLDPTGQPAGDTFAPSDLGHLVTVNAVFNQTIPEPSRALLSLIGLGAIPLMRRRR